jgi:uncharacterized membrane protein
MEAIVIPFVFLVAVFLLCRVLGLSGVTWLDDWRHCLRIALAAMFLLTASAHWGKHRADLVRMVPSAFKRPEIWVTLTGVAEIAGAVGLLIPSVVQAASASLILLLVAVFPANVRAARQHLTIGGRKVPGLLLRTIMQLIFIVSVIAAGWC